MNPQPISLEVKMKSALYVSASIIYDRINSAIYQFKRNIKRQVTKYFRDKNDFRVKCAIRTFFEGFDLDFEEIAKPVIPIPISSLGISKIQTKTKNNSVVVKVTLSRPGIFIGRAGSTIDALEKYIETSVNKPVQIHVNEFDPFSSLS